MKLRFLKKIAAAAAACVLVFALASCSSNEPAGGNADVTLDPAALADSLHDGLTFQDQLTALEGDAAMGIYSLDNTTVTQLKVYVSTGATAEEIAVIETVGGDAVQTVQDAMEKRIEDQKAAFQNYQPKEMTKLENPLVETRGKYVILCLSDDNDAARAIIDEAAGA